MMQHLAGMQSVSNKVVNFDKLHEVIQEADGKPTLFLNCLTESLIKYTKLDPESLSGGHGIGLPFYHTDSPQY